MRGIPVFRIYLFFSAALFLYSTRAVPFIQVGKTGSGSSLSSPVVKYHDANAVELAITNTGQIGNDTVTGRGARFWPRNTQQNYLWGTGLWIGGKADIDGDGEEDHLFIQAYDPLSSGSEFRDGRPDQDPDDPLATVFRSTDPDDISWWPEEFMQEDTDPGSPTFGQLIPYVISDQDFVTTYTTVGAIAMFATPSPPIVVRQRSLTYKEGLAGNVIFLFFEIENVSELDSLGPYALEDAWIGFDLDVDVGREFGDDRTSFFRQQVKGEGDSIPVNMAFAWDQDFHETNFTGTPGLVGIAYLQSPGNDHDGIDNDSDGMIDESPFNGIDDDADGIIDDMPDEVDQLGLVNYTFHNSPNTGLIRPHPMNDPEGYRVMSCDPPEECAETTECTDISFMVSAGPFRFAPGETHLVVMALVFANALGNPPNIDVTGDPPRPDPNDLVFEEFLTTKRVAQGLYDLGFLEANPPPEPVLSLIPGVGQVTVLWDDSPLSAADVTYDQFVTIDPDYRKYDFQGFRLWRSRTGLFSKAGDPDDPLNPIAKAHNEESPEYDISLLGQWDLRDGITTLSHGILVTDSLINQIGNVVVTAADTFELGEDKGLVFSYVDRGEIDTPLINGLNYYYCIESYDYNSAFLPTSSVSLGSGVEFSIANSASPRSDATSFIPAGAMISHVNLEGDPLPDETPEVFDFYDPPKASDALIDARFTLFHDEEIDDTHYTLVIDDIVPSSVSEYTPEGKMEVRFHVEDPNGNTSYIGGNLQSAFTMNYDSTITTLAITVFNPSDTTISLYEISLDFFADADAHRSSEEAWLTVEDSEGNDITETLGTFHLSAGQFNALGFRGTDITITWQLIASDTMTVIVEDKGNSVIVQLTEAGSLDMGWWFDYFGGQLGGRYLVGQPTVFRMYISGTMIAVIEPHRFPQDGDVWLLRQRSFYTDPYHPENTDTIPGSRPLVPGTRYQMNLTNGGQSKGEIDLSQIRVVPNPYLGYSEFEFGSGSRKIQFINLPAECTIRIYTISGVLVRVLDHTPAEAGTEDYDLKTREGLKLASGNYYYHLTTPDGRYRLGRFAIIQ